MAEFFESNAIWIIWIIFGLFFLIFLATAPCHAVLLLPLVGLPLFWLLPLGYALPINIATWLATPFLYRVIRKAMIRPVKDGFQSLIGTEAEVASLASGGSAKYLIRSQGELWHAYSTDVLEIGEQVNIVAVRGVGVVVKRAENKSRPGEIVGGESNQRHCH